MVKKKSKLSLKSDKYYPSQAEQKLLNIVLRPENSILNVTEICKMAEVSRDTFYRVMKNPDFKRLLREEAFNLIDPALPGVINRFIKEAKDGSFSHGKVVLEMGKVYTPKARFEGVMVNMGIKGLIEKLKKHPDRITEEERKELEDACGVVNSDGDFSQHLLLLEWMRKSEAGEDTSRDWRFLLLGETWKMLEKIDSESQREEIYRKLPGLKEAEEKEARERKAKG